MGLIVHRVEVVGGSEAQTPVTWDGAKRSLVAQLKAEVRTLCLVLVLK